MSVSDSVFSQLNPSQLSSDPLNVISSQERNVATPLEQRTDFLATTTLANVLPSNSETPFIANPLEASKNELSKRKLAEEDGTDEELNLAPEEKLSNHRSLLQPSSSLIHSQFGGLSLRESSDLEFTSNRDWQTLKTVCLSMRNQRPTRLEKPAKYQFKTVEWLHQSIREKLNIFEKSSRKLLNALIFLYNNMQLLETSANTHPSTEEVITRLDEYEGFLNQIKKLKISSSEKGVKGIIAQYGEIEKRELPPQVSSMEIQLLVKLRQYESEEAYSQFREKQLKLSRDYHIKREEMKNVWGRIEQLLKDVQRSFDRLKSRRNYFETKVLEKRDLATKRNCQIKKFEEQHEPHTQQMAISHMLNTNVNFVLSEFTSEQTEQATNFTKESNSTPNLGIDPTPMAREVNEAVEFSKELNWWLCEVTKWFEHIQVIVKSRSSDFPNEEKKEIEEKRFSALLAIAQSHLETLEENYKRHFTQLQGIILLSRNPLGPEGIQFALKQGISSLKLMEIEQTRTMNLSLANFNLTFIEKQWSELALRIQQLTNATTSFAIQANSHYSWNPLYWSWGSFYKP